MVERIELRFVGGYDEDEFLESTAYWVSNADSLRIKVQGILLNLINMMRYLDTDVFSIGQVVHFEGHKLHLIFERATI